MFQSTFWAWLICQILKMVVYFIRYGKLNFKLLVGTGGMPSSHSSFVSALTTAIGIREGFTSALFMISLGYAVIVISDAAGVRRAAGRQASILNKIIEDLSKAGKFNDEKLWELLGHSPIEVFFGILLGVFISIFVVSLY